MAEYTLPKYDAPGASGREFDWSSTFADNYKYPIVDNIFEGRPPSLNYSWPDSSAFDPDVFESQYGYSDPSRSQSSWVNKGLEALNKALSYKSQAGSQSGSGSRSYRGYSSNAPAVSQGRGYTMYMPSPTQKTTQSGGSRGIGGALGTLAGIGVSMIPGVGAAAAAAAPALGGTLGGFFG